MGARNIEEFELSITYKGEIKTERCTRFNVNGKTLIRVPVTGKNGFLKFVLIYYENLVADKRFFWYELPESKESLAKEVHKLLWTKLDPLEL